MDDATIFGGTLNQLGQTVKKTGQSLVKLPEEMGKDVGEQVAGVPIKQNTEESKVSGNKSQWQSDEERIKFLKDLYGSSPAKPSSDLAKQDSSVEPSPQSSASAPLSGDSADKEEQKKLLELRNQLHKDFYYDPTFNPVKKQEEERPAEKVEQEKKQEMQDLQQKDAKKPPPLAVVREQNKAEMFRGAAG